MTDTTDSDRRIDTKSIKSSYHAALRYLGRVDPTEPYPEERLKQIAGRAYRADEPDVHGAAYVDDVSGTLLVVDEAARRIITCWRRGETA